MAQKENNGTPVATAPESDTRGAEIDDGGGGGNTERELLEDPPEDPERELLEDPPEAEEERDTSLLARYNDRTVGLITADSGAGAGGGGSPSCRLLGLLRLLDRASSLLFQWSAPVGAASVGGGGTLRRWCGTAARARDAVSALGGGGTTRRLETRVRAGAAPLLSSPLSGL